MQDALPCAFKNRNMLGIEAVVNERTPSPEGLLPLLAKAEVPD